MNLYQLHSNPKLLNHHDEAHEKVPFLFWDIDDKLKKLKDFTPEQYRNILKSSKYSYFYAKDILKGRFQDGEKLIATNVSYACSYACYVLNGPFPLGEKIIATSAYNSLYYAINALEGPFPLGEPAIATDAYFAYRYAMDVLRGRFELGEKIILASKNAYFYKVDILHQK